MFLRNEGYWSIVGLLCELDGREPTSHYPTQRMGCYDDDDLCTSRAEGTLHLSHSDDVACLRHAVDERYPTSHYPTLRMG